jgi:hypothetical protein
MQRLRKPSILLEYSEGQIQKLFDRYKKENPEVVLTDVRGLAQRFDEIKPAIKARVERAKKTETPLDFLPKQFVEPDPKTGKIANYLDINAYSWKDLERIIDQFPAKVKVSKSAENPDTKDPDLVYEKDNLEIYTGDTRKKCIRLSNEKGQQYSFCIGRPQVGSNLYFNYRFGQHNRAFYFVFNRNQPVDKYKYPYHAFVIHVHEEKGTYGVTNAINEFSQKTPHEIANVSWREVGDFMVKNGGESGKDSWNRIKDLQSIFKYNPPGEDETLLALLEKRKLSLPEFVALPPHHKAVYIQNTNDLTPEQFRSLDTELKNLAINSGHAVSIDELENNTGLIRRYANYRFTRHPDAIIPYPFIPYLSKERQLEYYEKHSDKYLSFEEVQEYFDPEIVKDYVSKQVKQFGYLPEQATKYMSEKEKQLYSIYKLLYANVQVLNSDQTQSRKADTMKAMISPMTYEQFKELTPKLRQQFYELINYLTKDLKKNGAILTACPEVFEVNGKEYFFLKKTSNRADGTYVIVNQDGKIVVDDIVALELLKDGIDILFDSRLDRKYIGQNEWKVEADEFDTVAVYKGDNLDEPVELDLAMLNESKTKKITGQDIYNRYKKLKKQPLNEFKRLQQLAGLL